MEHQKTCSRWIAVLVQALAVVLLALALSPAATAEEADAMQSQGTLEPQPLMKDGKISLTLRDVPISEVMEMLSRTSRTNIL
ncbi:MAG: hypothetical protein OEN52_09270, partial [Gammaproteobacteria bacterium]|nr:hypothetical protein [Gammaproteobacteria bacterium]